MTQLGADALLGVPSLRIPGLAIGFDDFDGWRFKLPGSRSVQLDEYAGKAGAFLLSPTVDPAPWDLRRAASAESWETFNERPLSEWTDAILE
jgi:hypothetical protein